MLHEPANLVVPGAFNDNLTTFSDKSIKPYRLMLL